MRLVVHMTARLYMIDLIAERQLFPGVGSCYHEGLRTNAIHGCEGLALSSQQDSFERQS